jgi:hypothetical protein
MNEQELIHLWKAQSAKLDQSLTINKHLLSDMTTQKVRSSLGALSRFKTRGILTLLVYLLILGSLLSVALIHYHPAANYFIASIAAIFLINMKALYDYIKHLAWITNMDYNDGVIAMQQKLSRLQLSIIQHNRIMTLQFPFFTTFFLSSSWFPQSTPVGLIILQVGITGAFTYLSIWLYKNQTIENMDKKWFKLFYKGSGGKRIEEALAFYKELETYKAEAA